MCNPDSFKMEKVYSVYIGNKIACHFRTKISSLVPKEIKQSVSTGDFKSKIKKWTPSNCPCSLCEKNLDQDFFEKTYAHKFYQLFLLLSYIFLTLNI